MLAASDQPGDDLCNTALLALVGVGHQALHVWPQQGKKDVSEIAEQSLERAGEGNRFISLPADFSCFNPFNTTLSESHLEETESARAELVLSLTLLQGEELDELIDEDWVGEVVKDDLFPLSAHIQFSKCG